MDYGNKKFMPTPTFTYMRSYDYLNLPVLFNMLTLQSKILNMCEFIMFDINVHMLLLIAHMLPFNVHMLLLMSYVPFGWIPLAT